jgi:hypothetical protein
MSWATRRPIRWKITWPCRFAVKLLRYDTACRALEARSVGDVKEICDEAVAIQM